MTSATNTPGYWLNWRFLVSAIWVFAAMVSSALIILRYEGSSKSTNQEGEDQQEKVRTFHKDDVWKTCNESIHPVWLLTYRVIVLLVLLGLLFADAVLHGIGIFYFYTQWTLTLVTFYFGVGSLQSIYGMKSSKDLASEIENSDVESSIGSYAAQIIFQMCSGAVVLTDIVFWLIIYPFLTDSDYQLHFLDVCLHSVNAVFLLGEVALNRLSFPFFRIAYFLLWTCGFVIFQWIIHMCVSMWWPYSFLDLSSPYAPLWYLGVGALHFPCFFVFALIIRAKNYLLSTLVHYNAQHQYRII
ncbi:unnamed protein product [Cuscuta epithymum]|uniref:TLC domain-containing protein n=1 Tax=Cuscuta epithymum TaxID=186058 RepID=A0AAV0FSC2_9ASTE|nr:unnamed protein product [Cuscuta epithymum]CAH9138080.1 unnamed protein product [Cuscuta epithymum]